MTHRAVAWSEIAVLFLAMYAGIPWAGIQFDRLLRIPAWPMPIPWLGFGLLILGLGGLAWCIALFARVGRGTPNPLRPPEALVTIGPYAWTRNPIALAHAAALIGLSVLFGSVSAVLLVVLLAYPVHVAMLHEERTLERRFGDAYRAYRFSVPRWIPRRPGRQS